jgi:hypothetical protein
MTMVKILGFDLFFQCPMFLKVYFMVSSFCTSIQIVFFYGVCVLLVEVVLLCWN